MIRLMRFLLGMLSIFPLEAFASGASFEHADPIASVILVVTALFFFALVGRLLATRLSQPGVLGELLIGVILGNLGYLLGSELVVILREGPAIFGVVKEMLGGMPLQQAVVQAIPTPFYAQQVYQALASTEGSEYLKIAYVVDIFSRYGVIFLLFMVGLESSVDELKQMGRQPILVALIGVLVPMVLGFAVAYWMLPQASYQTSLFIAATLSATSVGITARVLSELNCLNSNEAKIILSAAVLDDVLGLIVLAIVTGLVINGTIDLLLILQTIGTSAVFFFCTLYWGPGIVRLIIPYLSFLKLWEVKLFVAFLLLMTLAWLAATFHLAAIIGAFIAGMILRDSYFARRDEDNAPSIHQLLAPLEAILAPVFFVLVGLQVKLETFYNVHVLSLATGLIFAAILGKLISGLGAGSNKLIIGIGMLPRGEVGLVFAAVGRTLGLITDDLFSAVVLMVMVTTFITPPLLKYRYKRTGVE